MHTQTQRSNAVWQTGAWQMERGWTDCEHIFITISFCKKVSKVLDSFIQSLFHHILILPKSHLVIASYTQSIAIYDASPNHLIIILSYPCSPQRPGYEQSRGANTVRSQLRASDDGIIINCKSGFSTKTWRFNYGQSRNISPKLCIQDLSYQCCPLKSTNFALQKINL